ncbi:MAG: pyruvate dehydrogenase, partial [Chloroflexi bacterium]|nr:pyruvate dehydrogenase [Chloroflexota bacterium]
MPSDFALPDLGEGIEEADILKIYVKEGDTLAVDQPVMEIETDKATLDVPSGVAGTIASLHVAEGQTITPGTILVTVLESDGAGAPSAPPAAPAPSAAAPPPPAPEPAP